jgi:hypothetical protein
MEYLLWFEILLKLRQILFRFALPSVSGPVLGIVFQGGGPDAAKSPFVNGRTLGDVRF